jgi:hypothetical protein
MFVNSIENGVYSMILNSDHKSREKPAIIHELLKIIYLFNKTGSTLHIIIYTAD